MQNLVENEGCVKSMNLPPGWIDQSKPRPAFAGPYWRIFRPSPDGRAHLSFFDRGRPVTESAVNALHALLAAVPATLTPADLQSLGEVLREAYLVDEFTFKYARTELLNAKPVIVIEGQWNELQEDCLWIITAEPQSNWICEIIYQAPKSEFAVHFETIVNCLKTIQWTF